MIFLLLALTAAAPLHDRRCDSPKTDDLLACGQAALDKANAELNARWKKMPHDRDLVRAQRAWLAWRDAECAAENYARNGGSQEKYVVELACLADMTQQRTKQLHDQYKWLAD